MSYKKPRIFEPGRDVALEPEVGIVFVVVITTVSRPILIAELATRSAMLEEDEKKFLTRTFGKK